MSVESCPKCGSGSFYHESKTGVNECLKCGHKWKKPTMKELMKGEVLNGYAEAARVKPLTEFHSPQAPVTARPYWLSLITDEEMADVEYRGLADMMAPGGPLEVATWVREMIWAMAEDEKRHAQQLKDMLDQLIREGKIV